MSKNGTGPFLRNQLRRCRRRRDSPGSPVFLLFGLIWHLISLFSPISQWAQSFNGPCLLYYPQSNPLFLLDSAERMTRSARCRHLGYDLGETRIHSFQSAPPNKEADGSTGRRTVSNATPEDGISLSPFWWPDRPSMRPIITITVTTTATHMPWRPARTIFRNLRPRPYASYSSLPW